MKSNSTGKTNKTTPPAGQDTPTGAEFKRLRARRSAASPTHPGEPNAPASPKRFAGIGRLSVQPNAPDDSWLPPAVDAHHDPDLRAPPAAPLPAPELPSLEAMGRAYVAAQDREGAAKEEREALGTALLARLQGEGVKALEPREGLRIIVLEGGGARTTVDANAAGLMITQLWDAIDGAARQLAALGAPFAPPLVARTLPTRAGQPSKPSLVVRSVALPRPRVTSGQP